MDEDDMPHVREQGSSEGFVHTSQPFDSTNYPPAFYFPEVVRSAPISSTGTPVPSLILSNQTVGEPSSIPFYSGSPRCEVCGHLNQDYRGASGHSSRSATDEEYNRGKSRKQQNEELDYWLYQLKDENPNLSWAKVAEEVRQRFGESYQIPTLQMRYKRYKLRLETELNEDDAALLRSHAFWERQKWDIICSKLAEYRPGLSWAPRECHLRWLQLEMSRLETSG